MKFKIIELFFELSVYHFPRSLSYFNVR